MSRRLRNRCRKTIVNKLDAELSQDSQDQLLPVAASSPDRYVLDDEDLEVINQAKMKVEEMKQEVSRQVRLVKFKLGAKFLKLPFNKSLFSKNLYESHQKSIADKSSNLISGSSSMSFTNAASSTKNMQNNPDKNSSYKLRNKTLNKSLQSRIKGNSMKEVTFRETTFEIPLSKYGQRSYSDEISGRETSTNSTFKIPSMKRQGDRAVGSETLGSQMNKPLSVLRRPTADEMAVSLFGSPLLVTADCGPTNMPQISLPTADGKVVAILPRDGFTVEDMPQIATPTRYQLRTLNRYLNDLCHQHANF